MFDVFLFGEGVQRVFPRRALHRPTAVRHQPPPRYRDQPHAQRLSPMEFIEPHRIRTRRAPCRIVQQQPRHRPIREIVKEENKPNDIEKQLADNNISTADNTEEEENANPQIEQGSADTEQNIAAIEKELEATPSWDIQIGAFSNYAKARQYAQKIQNKQFKNCNDCEIKVEAAESASAIVYRAKIVGFEKNDADKACKRLKNASISCIVVKNDSETTVTMASR